MTDLADTGAGGTKLPEDKGRRGPSANTAGVDEPEQFGFKAAGVMTATPGVPGAGSKRYRRRQRKAQEKADSTTPEPSYTPASLPSSEDLMASYTVGLATADQVFPVEMCKNPLPMLAAVVGVLAQSEQS